MNFEFMTASRILFGSGALTQTCKEIKALGAPIILVRSKNRKRSEVLLTQIPEPAFEIEIEGEPTVAVIASALKNIRSVPSPAVVAFGGGGVLDAGKAIAGLLTNPGEPMDYLEVIGGGKAIRNAAAPCAAIPTTAGTGSEVTKNAVLTSEEHKLKVSLRSHLLLPSIACVDPDLTLSMPPDITANTGMDAVSQVLESFVSPGGSPMTQALCREGLLRGRSLSRAYHHGSDIEARTDMALSSLIGGIALANSKLGAIHGFASPLGGMFNAPHGAVCAVLLGPVMRANIRALRERHSDSLALARYTEAARILTGNEEAEAEDGAEWAFALRRELGIAPLSACGVRESHFPELCVKARAASSMKGNPVELTENELIQILEDS